MNFLKSLFAKILLCYLRFWAKLAIALNNPIIIGLTGSAGKSSLRNAIFSIISPSFSAKMIEKGNSETGIPLGILGLQVKNYAFTKWLAFIFKAPFGVFYIRNTEYLVVEMGVDEPFPPKNMDYLLTIVRPKIGILLNVYPVHTMQFEQALSSQEKNLPPQEKEKLLLNAIAKQKSKILTTLPASGTAIYPKDFFYLKNMKLHSLTSISSPLLRRELKSSVAEEKNISTEQNRRLLRRRIKIKAKKLTFGSLKATCKVKSYQVSLEKGTEITLGYKKKNYFLYFPNYVLPKYYAEVFGAAFLAGISLNLLPEVIMRNLETNLVLPNGRASLIDGIKETKIIDSSYNSSLRPLLGMLALLDELAGKRKKIAVLGDMRELGLQTQLEHERAAQKAVKVADEIILVGPNMKQYFLPKALALKFPKNKIYHFENAFIAGDFLSKHLKGKELILVKGSQNTIFLEIVVKKIMKTPKLASQLLCRRGAFWNTQRANS